MKRYLDLCEKIGVPPVGYGLAILAECIGLLLVLYLDSLPKDQGDDIFMMAPGFLALAPIAMVQFCTRGPFAEQLPKLVIGFVLPIICFFATAAVGLLIFHG